MEGGASGSMWLDWRLPAFGAWDAAGASWFGYPTVWVNRFGRPVEKLDSGPIVTGRNIETLVDFVVRKKG